jgi:hypothetical protein
MMMMMVRMTTIPMIIITYLHRRASASEQKGKLTEKMKTQSENKVLDDVWFPNYMKIADILYPLSFILKRDTIDTSMIIMMMMMVMMMMITMMIITITMMMVMMFTMFMMFTMMTITTMVMMILKLIMTHLHVHCARD